MSGLDRLAALFVEARRPVAFTGAGVSTESGIPDFRTPGGVWTRFDPRQFTYPERARQVCAGATLAKVNLEPTRADPSADPVIRAHAGAVMATVRSRISQGG